MSTEGGRLLVVDDDASNRYLLCRRLTNRQDILDRLDQKERLEAFIKQWFTSSDGENIAGVFQAFQAADELEDLVENHLRKLANQHLAAAVTDSPVESDR